MSISFLIIAAATPVVAAHDVRIDHHAGATQVSYSAQAEVKTRTIGSSSPTKTDTQRCRWMADVVVERTPQNMPHLTRVVSRDQRLSGSLPGACAGKSKAIDREVAAREGEMRSHLLAVAEKDSKLLLAEINAAGQLASN